MKDMQNNVNLIDEKLTIDQVKELLKESKNWRTYRSIFAGTFTSWDGTKFPGYIVYQYKHTLETGEEVPEAYYFMETSLEEVPYAYGHKYRVTYSKLMPISAPTRPRKVETFDDVLFNNTIDKWEYTYFPMTQKELEERDWWQTHRHDTKIIRRLGECDETGLEYQIHPFTPSEQEEIKASKKKAEAEILERCYKTLPPAEDQFWYDILSMGYGTEGYELEEKALKILRKRGLNVRISGERDSFGWVTRGIFIDGECMSIY